MTIKTVDSKTLKKWLEKDEAVIIDVREPNEHEHCHIKGSMLMPSSKINAHSLARFKNKKIVFHCKLGRRSAMACEKVAKEDPKLQIYNLEGGIDAWQHCKFHCEMGKGSCDSHSSKCHSFTSLCVDDQVRVIFGSVICLGIVLGYYISDSFFWITGLLGAAYTISGFTKMCMLRNYLKCLDCNKGKDAGKCETTVCDMPMKSTVKTASTPVKAVSKPAIAKANSALKKVKVKGKNKGKRK